MTQREMDIVTVKDGLNRLTALGYLTGKQLEECKEVLKDGFPKTEVIKKLMYALMDNAIAGFPEPNYVRAVKDKTAQMVGHPSQDAGQTLQTVMRDRMVQDLLETDWFIPTLVRLL